MPKHVIEQGECLSSIAAEYEFDWKLIWKHGQNATLKQRRKNPNILLPGDELFVPIREKKEESRNTDKRHTFVKKNAPTRLRIRLLNSGKPLVNEDYELSISGQKLKGTTDSTGLMQETIPPDACSASLILGKEKREILLDVGHLDPLNSISGMQARLNNLGYDCGAVDGIVGPITRSALKSFQETYQLNITGEADSATLDKLKGEYGC